MGLALCIRLLGDTYEAGWGGAAEWPPHPARLFCGLVAAAAPGGPDDRALRWLEAQPPPTIAAAPARIANLEAFVPTNDHARASGGHQQYLGRTSALRRWPRSLPGSSRVVMEWQSSPPEDLRAHLETLVRRVPYLGRASSPVLVDLTDSVDTVGLNGYEARRGGRLRVRVPYPGYLDALRHAFEANQPAWSVEHTVAYGPSEIRAERDAISDPVRGPYPDMAIVGFPPGAAFDGRHAVAITRAFKAAVLERLGDPLAEDPWPGFPPDRLAILNGHHDGTGRQCAVVALPFIEWPRTDYGSHANGEILGVAVCLSTDLDPEVRGALLRLLGFDREDAKPRLRCLRIPGLRTVKLVAADNRKTLSAGYWQGPASRWISALPVVLDWWPRRGRSTEELIARGCEVAGLPRPTSVDVLPTSAAVGTPLLRRFDTLRRPGDPVRPLAHVALTFPTKVQGPVIVGHLRHLGLGLCLPGPA
jgi:CRISPR-associated protein Csb2